MSSGKSGAPPFTADLFFLEQPLSPKSTSGFEAFEKYGLILEQDRQSLSPGPHRTEAVYCLSFLAAFESICQFLICFLFLSLEESFS